MKLITSYKLQNYLKRSLLIMLLALGLSLVMHNYFHYLYNKEINSFISSTIKLIEEKYPNISEKEILDIINNPSSKDLSLLPKYGIDNNLNILKKIDQYNKYSNILLTIFIIGISLSYLIIYLIESKKKNKEIVNVIESLKKVNEHNFDLEIELEEEGNMALLKDEVYKYSQRLKEYSEKNLKDKLDLKDNLANISHQIKTPLTSISILVDNLLDEPNNSDIQKEFLQDIRRQIDNINFLVLSLLKLSKFEANVIVFQKEKINVSLMLNRILQDLDPLIKEKNLKVYQKGSKNVFLYGDYKWEIEALTNILKNSVEHTEPNKSIYLSYNSNAIVTKIVIADEGGGITKENIQKVFNRFYQEENSLNNFGIGLSLAKEIINKDNGKIIIKSKEKEGTIFEIKYFHENP